VTNGGETACATKTDQQFASVVGQAVSPASEFFRALVSMRANAKTLGQAFAAPRVATRHARVRTLQASAIS